MNNDIQNQIDDLKSQILELQIKSDSPVNLSDIVSVPTSQTVNDPFYSFMMWGIVAIVSGTGTVADTRIKSTSTVVIAPDAVNLVGTKTTAANPANGSCVFTAGGATNYNVYYLIIF